MTHRRSPATSCRVRRWYTDERRCTSDSSPLASSQGRTGREVPACSHLMGPARILLAGRGSACTGHRSPHGQLCPPSDARFLLPSQGSKKKYIMILTTNRTSNSFCESTDLEQRCLESIRMSFPLLDSTDSMRFTAGSL